MSHRVVKSHGSTKVGTACDVTLSMNVTTSISPTTRTSFSSASDAYDYWYWKLFRDGQDFGNTKALFNVGFYITNPKNNYILNKDRKWSQEYAEAEWQWYLSGDPSR